MSQDRSEEEVSGRGLGKKLLRKAMTVEEEIEEDAPLLADFMKYCKENDIGREEAGRIMFSSYDRTLGKERARRVAFARNVFKRVAALEMEEYERRCARFDEFNSQTTGLSKETYDLINAARAAGKFSSYPSTSHLTFVCAGYPPMFRLDVNGMLFGEAVRFFEYWKRAHPTAEPTEESRLVCLADIDQMLAPADADFPADDFVSVVMESFDLWKQGQ
jgi:hypothetical protein